MPERSNAGAARPAEVVRAREIMTTPVITVTATASVDDVAQALKRDEDHYPERGPCAPELETVADADVPALHIARLAARDLPGSATRPNC